jgi:hypothetical protein
MSPTKIGLKSNVAGFDTGCHRRSLLAARAAPPPPVPSPSDCPSFPSAAVPHPRRSCSSMHRVGSHRPARSPDSDPPVASNCKFFCETGTQLQYAAICPRIMRSRRSHTHSRHTAAHPHIIKRMTPHPPVRSLILTPPWPPPLPGSSAPLLPMERGHLCY